MNQSIIIAFGGPSPEHEVSVLTGMQVMAALEDTGYQTIPLYVTKSGRWLTGQKLRDLKLYKDLKLTEASGIPCAFVFDKNGRTMLQETSQTILRKQQSWNIHAVIPAFHGSDGENGAFQGVCEVFNIPYAGSGVMGSSVGMDKLMAKNAASLAGWNVVSGFGFFESEWEISQNSIMKKAERLGFPVFVKPVHLGSSIGVTRADDKKNLLISIESAFRFDNHLLIEKAVFPLREINCSVIGTPENARASVCEQPVGKDSLLSFEDKYLSGETSKGMASAGRIIPAPISDKQTDEIQQMAVGIFKTLGCSGVARIDFLMNEETGKVYFNEINTIPGSFSFYLWDKSGLSFPDLLQELIKIGKERHQMRNGRQNVFETNLLSTKAATGLKGLKIKKS